jgi:hypothetical protein
MQLTSIFSSFTRSAPPDHLSTAADCNDPRDNANILGTVCDIHGCQRVLDEAPLVQPAHLEDELLRAKRSLFPNSWRAIASLSALPRAGWFRHRRTKMIAVRYCEKCRAAAEKWLEDHMG